MTVSADRINLLLFLAARPDQAIGFAELAAAVRCDTDELQRHVEAIREILGDTGPHPRFIATDDTSATLIAPVRAGVGQANTLVDDDGDKAEASFLQQLQRRNVVRVGAAYIVLAWVAIQVSDTVMPALGLPPWAVTLTIGVAMLGFPVALVIAWFFEITAVGTLRDKRRAPAKHTGKQKAVDVAVLSCLAIVAGYLALGVFTDVKNSRDRATLTAAPSQVVAAANTVAVLPFRHIGANPDNAYIGDGIAEEILRLLSRLKELNVAARTASFYFKDKDVLMETMAQRLKVRHLLTGSVQIAGDSIRVNAELIDAATGYQLWSDTFDRQMADIFAIQSEIARAVADESQVVLSDTSNAVLDSRPTNSLEAYDYYLRGRDYLRQPRTSDVLASAQRLFHRALALDPEYTLALAGLCETHLAVYIRTRSVATVDDAESVCTAALEIDESLPEVHTALGYLYWHTGEFDRAEAQFRTAIVKDSKFYEAFSGLGDTLVSKNQLDEARLVLQQQLELQPGYWQGYNKLGSFYYRQGKDAEALPYFEEVTNLVPDSSPGWNNLGAVNYMLGNFEAAANAYRRGVEIAPTQSLYINLGAMYYYFGRFQDAVDAFQEAIDLAPDDFRSWGRLGAAYFQMEGRSAEANAAYAEAISLANEIIRINPNEFDAHKNIALFYAHTDQFDLAMASMDKAIELAPQDPDTRFIAALALLTMGERERSIEELEEAVALGYSKKLIASEPALEALRDNERFKVLLATTATAAP